MVVIRIFLYAHATRKLISHSKQILEHVLIMFYVIEIGVNAHNPANTYWSKVKKRNTGKRCTICSKLTIMTPERP